MKNPTPPNAGRTKVDELLRDRPVEELPQVSIKTVKESGLLAQAIGDLRGASITLDGVLSKPLQILRNSAFTVELIWPYGRGSSRQLIGLEWSSLTWGTAISFICPITFKPCRTLYFYGGRFASRAGHGIRYSTQRMKPSERAARKDAKFVEKLDGSGRRGPSRGENRKRLIGELWDKSKRGVGELSRASILKEAERLTRSRDIAAAVVHEPMRRAMKEGREGFKWLKSDDIRRDVENGLAQGETERTIHPWAPREPLTNYPMIDIRSLRPRPRVARSHALRWTASEVVESAQIFVSLLGEDDRPELWVAGRWGFGSIAVRQIVKLEYGDPRRHLYMICPVLGTRCLKLYLRNGYFASRQAHRLDHVPKVIPAPPNYRSFLADWREPTGIPRRRAKSPFGKSSVRDSLRVGVMIQALDVDREEPWPNGQDRQEDQALPI